MRAPGRVFAVLVALAFPPALANAGRVDTGTTTRFIAAGAMLPCGSDGGVDVSFDPGVLDETLSGTVTCGAVHTAGSLAHVSFIGPGGFVEATGTLHAEATAPSPTSIDQTNVEEFLVVALRVHEHVSVRIRGSASASATLTPPPTPPQQGSPPSLSVELNGPSEVVFRADLRPLVNGPVESIEFDELVVLSPGDYGFALSTFVQVPPLPAVTNTVKDLTYEIELRPGPDLPSLSPPGVAALAALLLLSGACVRRRAG